MIPLERLHSDLAHARALAEREGSDRHSNPGRAARDLRQQMQAQSRVNRLERALEIAAGLDAQEIVWTADVQGQLFFLFADGSTYPLGKGEVLDGQVEIVRAAASPYEARRALTVDALDPHASRDLKWLRERLVGVSTPKFRSAFLTRAGLLEEGALTTLGRVTGFFNEHEGEYGLYQSVTASGAAWIYAAYLAGSVPMTAASRKLAPQRDIELDVILDTVGLPTDLEPSLAALTHDSAGYSGRRNRIP